MTSGRRVPPLDRQLRRHLSEMFADEFEALETSWGLDLSIWRDPAAVPEDRQPPGRREAGVGVNRPLEVLIVSQPASYGVAVYVRQLTEAAVAAGHHVTVVSPGAAHGPLAGWVRSSRRGSSHAEHGPEARAAGPVRSPGIAATRAREGRRPSPFVEGRRVGSRRGAVDRSPSTPRDRGHGSLLVLAGRRAVGAAVPMDRTTPRPPL